MILYFLLQILVTMLFFSARSGILVHGTASHSILKDCSMLSAKSGSNQTMPEYAISLVSRLFVPAKQSPTFLSKQFSNRHKHILIHLLSRFMLPKDLLTLFLADSTGFGSFMNHHVVIHILQNMLDSIQHEKDVSQLTSLMDLLYHIPKITIRCSLILDNQWHRAIKLIQLVWTDIPLPIHINQFTISRVANRWINFVKDTHRLTDYIDWDITSFDDHLFLDMVHRAPVEPTIAFEIEYTMLMQHLSHKGYSFKNPFRVDVFLLNLSMKSVLDFARFHFLHQCLMHQKHIPYSSIMSDEEPFCYDESMVFVTTVLAFHLPGWYAEWLVQINKQWSGFSCFSKMSNNESDGHQVQIVAVSDFHLIKMDSDEPFELPGWHIPWHYYQYGCLIDNAAAQLKQWYANSEYSNKTVRNMQKLRNWLAKCAELKHTHQLAIMRNDLPSHR